MTPHNDKPMERLERFIVSLITRKDSRLVHDRGVLFLLALLRYLSHVYRGVVELRLWLYDQGLLRHHSLGCQVIGIGNLTVGGTGKTPVVEVFARDLQRAGRRWPFSAVVTRRRNRHFRSGFSMRCCCANAAVRRGSYQMDARCCWIPPAAG